MNALVLVFFVFQTSCALLTDRPKHMSPEARQKAFSTGALPLEKPVVVRWNAYSVPMIEAETDRDLFLTWGYTSTHLRWGQMELLRRISQARIAEFAGPLAVDLDHTLRVLNLRKGLKERMDRMPKETLQYLTAFVEGINAYVDQAKDLPVEFKLLAWEKEKWTIEDVLLIGRLASSDLTLGFYYQYLQLEKNPDFQQRYKEVIKSRRSSDLSARMDYQGDSVIERLLWGATKSGSNSLVVGKKLTSGAAVIANDPHLGIFLPNLWMVIGVRSPSFTSVGLSIPGLPFVAVGRSIDHAWGGTNMRTISTHLYELGPKEIAASRTRKEKIKVRWWFDREITIRDSDYGPIISDTPYFKSEKTLAVDWIGHDQNTDDLTAFIKASRAKNFGQFQQALKDYAVSGQTLTYADRSGNIGMVLAARVRKFKSPDLNSKPIKTLNEHTKEVLRPTDLPSALNPPAGFIASANNRPLATEFDLAQSFAADDRILRLKELTMDRAKAGQNFDFDFLRSVQMDVVSQSSKSLANEIGLRWKGDHMGDVLKNWDGSYTIESEAALTFEVMLGHLSEKLDQKLPKALRGSSLAVLPIKDRLATLLKEEKTDAEIWASLLKQTRRSLGDKRPTWGEYHRQVFQTPMGFLPLIGSRFIHSEFPVPGGNETLNKSGNPISTKPSKVTYGAQSRHISDLSHIDENYFALLGGQDGWLWSDGNADQLPLWREGRYFRFPLSREGLDREFTNVVRFAAKPNL
jgi:penicillin amidase